VATTPRRIGITRFGGYIPRMRMQRAAIAAAHQWMAPDLRSIAKGERAFCSWDEDSVTMAVEAARDASPCGIAGQNVALVLATTTPPLADLSGAVLAAGALNLAPASSTLDVGHSQRSGVGALRAILESSSCASLLLVSDHPSAKPASAQEMTYGAGAAAFATGDEGVVVELLGSASIHSAFVDHFRAASQPYDYVWEERWVRDEGFAKIIPPVVRDAMTAAGVSPTEVKHFVFGSPLKDAAAMVAKKCGFDPAIAADSLSGCGYAGSAHTCLMLAHQLERATPGDVLIVVGFGQGCDVLVLRATEAIRDFKPIRGVSGALTDGQSQDAYLKMLAFDRSIELEWGMRAEKQLKTSLTEQYRSSGQLSNFVAGKCSRCQTVQFPQLAYCVNPSCAASSDAFRPISLADQPAQVLTYTADWLSYHPSPPLYVGFVQFDIGARLLMEIADVGASGLDVGMPLKMVHRIKDVDSARGYPRYFWKATPLQA
jgi:3-hydroxy-3-methylglutaryl CoA synthase